MNQHAPRKPIGGEPRLGGNRGRGAQLTMVPRSPEEWGRFRVYKNKKVKPTEGAPNSPNPKMPRRPDDRRVRGYRPKPRTTHSPPPPPPPPPPKHKPPACPPNPPP